MEVGNETERIVYDFPVELDDREYIAMFEYARDAISEEDFERIMIEWAMVDILEKKLKEMGFDEKSD